MSDVPKSSHCSQESLNGSLVSGQHQSSSSSQESSQHVRDTQLQVHSPHTIIFPISYNYLLHVQASTQPEVHCPFTPNDDSNIANPSTSVFLSILCKLDLKQVLYKDMITMLVLSNLTYLLY